MTVKRIEKRIEKYTFWKVKCVALSDRSTYRYPVIGAIAFVSDVRPSGRIEVLISETSKGLSTQDFTWTYTENEFWYCFDELPEGEQAVDALIAEYFDKARKEKQEIRKLNIKTESLEDAFKVRQLPNVDPPRIKKLTDGGEIKINEPVPNETEQALTVVEKLDRVGQADQIKDVLATTAKDMKNSRKALQMHVKASKALMRFKFETSAAMCRVKDTVEQLEKVMVTLNLYLGANEDILQIKMGEWGKENTPLSVRQLVLFMDEESLIAAESDTPFDFKNVYDFDDWLCDPENLKQVLPEERGIVCLKPRRSDLNYSDDPIHNYQLNKENRRTYILIRNGENLFRIVPTWSIGETMFPSKKEMDECFIKKSYNYDTNKYETKTVKAGTDAFDKAVEQFDTKAIHYRNTLTIIQGIIDRTGIFPDLQEAGVNVLNVAENSNYINYINDAENAYLLRDGNPTFREWQKATNAKLIRGNRVIVLFETYNEIAEKSEGISEILPVDKWQLNTITREMGDQINISVKRLVWDRKNSYSYNKEYIEGKTKGAIQVDRETPYILAYDLANTNLINHFLNDRLSRENYTYMIPLLKHLKRLKEQEEKDEKPVRDLITAQILNRMDLTKEQAELKAQEKINWWKFKNIRHRSIMDDPDTAVKMIMKELNAADRIQELKAVFAKAENELIDDKTIKCFKKGRNFYHVWEHAFSDSRIWVNEKIYKYVYKKFVFVSEGGKHPNFEPASRNVIFENEKEVAEYPKYKTDDVFFYSKQQLLPFIPDFAKKIKRQLSKSYWDKFEYVEVFPVRFYYDRPKSYWSGTYKHYIYADVIRFSITDGKASIDIYRCSDRILTNRLNNNINNDKQHKGLQKYFDKIAEKLKNKTFFKPFIPEKREMHLQLCSWEFPRVKKAEKNLKKYIAARETISDTIFKILETRTERIEAICEAAAKKEYLEKKGDPRNWESYKKRRGFDVPDALEKLKSLTSPITDYLLDHGADAVAGLEFETIVERLTDIKTDYAELFPYIPSVLFSNNHIKLFRKELKKANKVKRKKINNGE